jgi:hypothetical protein
MVTAYPGSPPHRKFAIFLGFEEALHLAPLIPYPWVTKQFREGTGPSTSTATEKHPSVLK